MTHDFPNKNHHNPQNPYISAMVSASAGSGKTFQLSRRFLGLVAAGAQPSSILAVTFSKKAAAEMRERIVQDAIALGHGSSDFLGFYDDLRRWRDLTIASGLTVPPLLSAKDVQDLITHSSQSLSITTIDAILMEWCLRFPWETKISHGEHILAQPWDIATREESRKMTREAWKNSILKILTTQTDVLERRKLLQYLISASPEEQLTVAWQRLENLRSSETFIWLCEHLRGTAALPYDTDGDYQTTPASDEDLLHQIADDLRQVIVRLSNPEKRSYAFAALDRKSFDLLIQCGLFTKERKLHGVTVSKKIRDEVGEACERIDRLSVQYGDRKRLARLNDHTELLWQLYRAWTSENLAAKVGANRGTFADALKGVWQLFCERNPGARWMIQNRVKHLLLDEFQDTSRLQWGAFVELARDILSGKTTELDVLPGSVFIVGDAKQSIYGFREAAPEIMDMAVQDLESHGLEHIQMSASWRTSPVVLSVVNEVFQSGELIPTFPHHETAKRGRKLAVPDIGSVTVLQIPDHSGSKELTKEHVDLEAASVASYIQQCLSGEIPCPVWDKKLKSFRKPQPTDFAILYHAKTDAEIYEEALRSKHIPAMREERKGFYDRQEIRDVTVFLRWLAWPDDSLSLCALLKTPACGLSDADLLQLITPGGLETSKTLERPEQLEEKTLTTNAILDRLKHLDRRLYDLLQEARSKTSQASYLQILLWWFQSTGIVAAYKNAFGSLEGQLASANLLKLIDTVRAAESGGHGHIQSLLDQFKLWSDEDETGNASTAADAVHLMTVHKSKGLEFPVVVLVGLAKDWFRSDKYWLRSVRSGHEGLSYVATAADQPLADQDFRRRLDENEANVRAEKARLLYVGMTRAQFHLVISSGHKPTKNQIEPAPESFFAKIRHAVANLGAKEYPYGLSLERSQLQGHLTSEATDELLSNAATREARLEIHKPTPATHSALPRLSILTATAHALQNVLKNESRGIQGAFEITDDDASEFDDVKSPVIVGKCIHRIFELTIAKRPDLVTKALLVRWARNLTEYKSSSQLLSEDDLELMVDQSIASAEACMKSQAWRILFFDAVDVFQEMSLASVQTAKATQNLVIGQPDLVVEKTNGDIWIVDYKSGQLPPRVNPVDHCRMRGYDVQVQTYGRAIQKIYSGRSIKLWILFTRGHQLVEIMPG